ncbi:IMPACT family protein [Robertkochia aurantiaca]|uniref:IMPACT family protein n=1 Tax=Robertkochia aurantiaca TaxID=2873700 RepID=UPI001CCF3605|nr:YigZ family protein [Robertkochia sp. 3YJGBD-33]
METDAYLTLKEAGTESLFKDRGSKFFGYAFPVSDEDDIKERLEEVKAAHSSARHWCYAWSLGADGERYRANDDGEPANSAGMPIYGQIQSFNLTDVLIVVVRYFGGVKLGVGGLINAYRTAAQAAIENSTIIEKTIDQHFLLSFKYADMNNVMRVIKEKNLNIIEQNMHLTCQIEVSIRKKDADQLVEAFKPFYEVKVTLL